jgi:TPR repeat protein
VQKTTEKELDCKAKIAIESGDYSGAITLLHPLAEANSEFALLSLGWIYETGSGTASDKVAAKLFYKRAASIGSDLGCFELGRLLVNDGNDVEARSAFVKGAGLGHAPSMSRLGRMMVQGRGGGLDKDTGAAWLEKAAAQGHILAQRHLIEIKYQATSSVIKKILLKLQIGGLIKKYVQEMWKNPKTDKIR